MTFELDLLIAVAFLAPVLLFVILEIALAGARADVGRFRPVAEVVPFPPIAAPGAVDATNDADERPMRQAA